MAERVAFDEREFVYLIMFITSAKKQLDEQLLKPTKGLVLDESLKSFLKPGSSDWPIVVAVQEAAGSFGTTTRERLRQLSKELGDFIKALNDAKAALKKGDDLATMSASEFLERFPGLAPPGTSSFPGGGNKIPGGSTIVTTT